MQSSFDGKVGRSDKVKNPSNPSKSSNRIGKRFVRFVRFVGFVGLSDRIAMETHRWISKKAKWEQLNNIAQL